MKPKDVAARLGVSVKTLQRWDKAGIFPAARNPQGRRYYTEEQVLAYLGKYKTPATARRLRACVLGRAERRPRIAGRVLARLRERERRDTRRRVHRRWQRFELQTQELEPPHLRPHTARSGRNRVHHVQRPVRPVRVRLVRGAGEPVWV
ncbi:transcriptional regulator, MerR family [Bifidobacterium gallicum DSM 20093 = LMG 11596]|uniref:Transcriptional regulator, MerR family n=1 Tax=Bifidobacterium gallicum DSM 20093 = LMG 11596 TaxID=561180 RepID=D1NUJ5_9BIFI|nr:transcriptional regulator, MerR family [Bifidobacterium gallicum DSM 20093 = LMG 11596]